MQALGIPIAFGVLILLMVVLLLVQAVFIHVAAGITGLRGARFGTAFKAALFTWVLQLALPCVFGFLLGASGQAGLAQGGMASVVSLLAGTLAVKVAYDEGLLKSLITYLLALVLTVVVLVGLVFALLAMGVLSGTAAGAA